VREYGGTHVPAIRERYAAVRDHVVDRQAA
jgi:hypothetical protein